MLDGLLTELRTTWPGTAWDEAMLRPYLDASDPPVLDGPHRADLLWAWACLACDPDALARLESGPIAAARTHLQTMKLEAALIEDAAQRAFARMVADRTALAAYRGRGPLQAFVRTIVVRFAIAEQRGSSRAAPLTDAFAAPSPDPELEYMRRLYSEHLASAFQVGWNRLGAHERFLLALQLHEGMTIDDLARVYSVHRATAARRAAAARSSLLGHIRGCLRERLAVTDETLDSILRIVTTSVRLPVDAAP